MVVGCVGVGWDIKNVLLHARLEPYTTAQVKHTTLLSTTSFHENHQALGASLGVVLEALDR